MKRLLIALAATAVCISGTAQAHTELRVSIGAGYAQDDDWINGGDSYDEFQQEYHHILQGIRHGLSDGSFTRYEAAQFYRELQDIRVSAYYAEAGWDDSSDEIQARLERLHERMHEIHDRRHDEEENSDWNRNTSRYYRSDDPYRY